MKLSDEAQQLQALFLKYSEGNTANVTQRTMHREGFIQALSEFDSGVQFHGPLDILHHQYGVLFDLVDEKQAGVISYTDFSLFHDLTQKPRAEYEILYRLFDRDGKGQVSADQFLRVLRSRVSSDNRLLAPAFTRSEVYQLLFGSGAVPTDGKTTHDAGRQLSLEEFSQLVKSLQEERLRLEFKANDPEGTGFVSADDFARIVKTVSAHKLTPFVEHHLATLGNLYVSGGSKVSWAVVMAFHNVLRQLDLIRYLIRQASKQSADGAISKSDFVRVAHQQTRSAVFTPIEVDILFHFTRLRVQLEKTTEALPRVALRDFEQVLAPLGAKAVPSDTPVHSKAIETLHDPGWVTILRQVYNFALGSVAGAVGATVVYPIDLVKTRMQNVRKSLVGEVLYLNSWDCFKKTVRNEGVVGLYSGLGPQLVGVAPEKAIKLTVNDLVRSILRDDKTGEIPLWGEILAGCTAGGSQVLFTNPLEIVKIRLQIQGEALAQGAEGVVRRSAMDIVKELGVVGLYKGTSACLLRDIPFSGIYFTAYSHLKKDYFGECETKKLSLWELLCAGAIAGMPSAYLTTPADVIKTRLQVEARKGQSTYNGIGDAFRKILREEGPTAFFKGGPARIFRSSPQFGVTLMTYELLQDWVPFPWSHHKSSTTSGAGAAASNDAKPQLEDHGLFRLRSIMRLMHDIDYQFGMVPVSASKK